MPCPYPTNGSCHNQYSKSIYLQCLVSMKIPIRDASPKQRSKRGKKILALDATSSPK
jgi:hypothetical protein